MQNTAEDISNQASGYKATLSNPNVSDAAKKNAEQALKDLGGEDAFYGKQGDQNISKNPNQVAGGLKAAINNPDDNDHTVYEEGKQAAQKKLDGMSK